MWDGSFNLPLNTLRGKQVSVENSTANDMNRNLCWQCSYIIKYILHVFHIFMIIIPYLYNKLSLQEANGEKNVISFCNQHYNLQGKDVEIHQGVDLQWQMLYYILRRRCSQLWRFYAIPMSVCKLLWKELVTHKH